MPDTPRCPKCNYEYTYFNGTVNVCTDCNHEWDSVEAVIQEEAPSAKIIDVNGNELVNGDTVMLIKDLPVKGFSKSLKAGTKVKNIRLSDGDQVTVSAYIVKQTSVKATSVRKLAER